MDESVTKIEKHYKIRWNTVIKIYHDLRLIVNENLLQDSPQPGDKNIYARSINHCLIISKNIIV